MFEEQYRKYCREIKPSEALNDETLALMKEARDHRPNFTPRPSVNWKKVLVLPLAATAAAAVVALVVVGAWVANTNGWKDSVSEDSFDDTFVGSDMEGPQDYEDALDDLLEDHKGNSTTDKNDPGSADNSTGNNKPSADSNEDSADSSADNSTGSSSDNNNGSSADNSTGSDPGEDKFASSGNSNPAGNSQKPGSSDDNDTNDGEETPETPEEDEEHYGAAPSQPYGPEISDDKNIKTYLTVREFLDELTQKTAPGYAKNYYNARELLILPNLLPDGARFRHLHLDTRTGKYSYSYHFTKDQKDYIIDIEVDATTPKSLNELRLFKENAANEQVLTAKEGDRLYYRFGEQDLVTVTLTDVTATEPLTLEETATLLAQFGMERCSLLNPVLDMKY